MANNNNIQQLKKENTNWQDLIPSLIKTQDYSYETTTAENTKLYS